MQAQHRDQCHHPLEIIQLLLIQVNYCFASAHLIKLFSKSSIFLCVLDAGGAVAKQTGNKRGVDDSESDSNKKKQKKKKSVANSAAVSNTTSIISSEASDTSSFTSHAASDTSLVARLRTEIEQLKTENEKVVNHLDHLKKDYDVKSDGFDRLKGKNHRLNKDKQDLKVDNAAKDNENRTLRKQLRESEKRNLALQRRLVSEDTAAQRQQVASEVQQQQGNRVAGQGDDPEKNEVDEDDKRAREVLRDTIIKGNVGWEAMAGMQELKDLLKKVSMQPIAFPALTS